MPDFIRSSEELVFTFVSSQNFPTKDCDHDATLQIKIVVFRESSHHNKNIMPLMDALNLFSIACYTR